MESINKTFAECLTGPEVAHLMVKDLYHALFHLPDHVREPKMIDFLVDYTLYHKDHMHADDMRLPLILAFISPEYRFKNKEEVVDAVASSIERDFNTAKEIWVITPIFIISHK